MMFTSEGGHFLSRRDREDLIRYGRNLSKTPADLNKLIEEIRLENPYAFHTEKTLTERVFFHCPKSAIPYKVCYKKEIDG